MDARALPGHQQARLVKLSKLLSLTASDRTKELAAP
jgi:hypothetical protein